MAGQEAYVVVIEDRVDLTSEVGAISFPASVRLMQVSGVVLSQRSTNARDLSQVDEADGAKI